MNKVIIEKNQFEVHGNTVLAPDESFRKRKDKDLEESRKQENQRKKQKDIKNKKSVLTNIFLGFVIGVIIVARYCMIYNYQEATAKAKTELEMLTKENDAYEVELIKFRNISYIEKTATQKLHMVKPSLSDVQYLNLSKNNLKTNEGLQVKKSNIIINKIKSSIF